MTDYTENNGVDFTNNYTVNRKSGYKITTKMACSIVSVTLATGCTATTVYLCSSPNPESNIIATASVSSGTATFATPQSLSNATSYYVLADKGSNYTLRYGGNGHMPHSGTAIDWILGYDEGIDQGDNQYNIQEMLFRTGPDYTKVKISVGAAAKSLAGAQISVGGAMKTIAACKIMAGGAAKTVF